MENVVLLVGYVGEIFLFCLLKKLPFDQMSLIFGTNSRHNVAVVDASINAVIVTKANVTRSAIKLANTTTMALVMTTL